MTKWLAGGVVAGVALLSVCVGAQAKEFRVYTCTVRDNDVIQQRLGPTIGYPNLPAYGTRHGQAWCPRPSTISAPSVIALPSEFMAALRSRQAKASGHDGRRLPGRS